MRINGLPYTLTTAKELQPGDKVFAHFGAKPFTIEETQEVTLNELGSTGSIGKAVQKVSLREEGAKYSRPFDPNANFFVAKP